ncbi:MAG: mannose-1-phosphate guanylyltransferase [Bacillota bacterium]|nr:mannose-1-phosphate guanylyltransferase [Bacillota bacterium]
MLCALIMAGGKGERFWPLSTDEKPKQFLKLIGEETMIQMTVKRLEKLIPVERIFVVTAKRYVDLVKEQLPKLPESNIIVEPVGRNTAPCIALSAFIIEKYYKNATIAVLPSDHLIVNEDKFINTLGAANKFVEDNESAIVTIGMKPDRPETGYGYIEYSEVVESIDEFKVRSVRRFVEKPNLETAQKYLNKGDFLWNAGMFVWRASTILELTNRFLTNTFNVLNEIAVTCEEEFDQVLELRYENVDNVSVDYGIMEKAENIYVIPTDFGWDDVGTWYSVERYRDKDENNNVCVGDIKHIDSHNNIIVGNGKPIVVVGLDDVFVVESDDVIFVGSKENIKNIKDIKNKVC